MATHLKKIVIVFCVFAIGIVIGGYLFSDTQPRSVLSLQNCSRCLSPSELLGLMASVGIQHASGLIPSGVKETDKTIAVKSPAPQARIHFLILPKKDIKDVGNISPEDAEYVTDMMQVIASLIQENKLDGYKIISNGPDIQQLNYLHFHLIAD